MPKPTSPARSKPRSRRATPPLPTPHSALPTPHSEVVLLAVTGMSPAVLTETVWALAHAPEPVIPERVIVVTTASGRDCLERELCTPRPAFGDRTVWQALRDALHLKSEIGNRKSAIQNRTAPLTLEPVRVIAAPDPATGRTRELADLRTPADNEAAADFLLDQVRSIVENPDTTLIASLAGGRKTMGALLYACLTLVGRESDRLTHVLVNEPFETLRGFFFPGQPSLLPSAVRGQTSDVGSQPSAPGAPTPHSALPTPHSAVQVDPSMAQVELADVPFVPLRNLFVRELGRKAGTFSRLVATGRDHVRQRVAETLRLSVDTTRPELEVNGTCLRLAPLEQLLLIFLARRAKHGEPAYGAYGEAVEDLNAFRTTVLAERPKDNFGDWRYADSLRHPWDEQEIRKAVSGIRAKLRQKGGEAATLAACLPEKGRCSLDLPGPLIHLK